MPLSYLLMIRGLLFFQASHFSGATVRSAWLLKNTYSNIYHGQEVYITNIPLAVEDRRCMGIYHEERRPEGYISINLRTPAGGITLLYTLIGHYMV
jgi:hypothetical protein